MKYELPKSIMIDLDDTIIANEVYKDQCWEQIKEEFSSPGLNIEEIVRIIKRTSGWFWSDPQRHREWRQHLDEARRHICALSFSKCGVEDAGLSANIADRFGEIRDQIMKPFPGAIETLGFLKEKGVKLALVTNGSASAQRSKVQRFGLSGFFEYIYIEGEHEHGKPDYEVYKYTLKKLETSHSDAWMIGDKYEWEVAAPFELGIKGIWVNSRKKRLEANGVRPFLTLATLSDLRKYVD